MELQVIQNKIYEIRGERVMLDFDLAEMYGVQTKRLKEQVRRNIERFPDDFMFELTKNEWKEVVANCDHKLKYSHIAPIAFTQEGVAMLSSVLRSLVCDFLRSQIVTLKDDDTESKRMFGGICNAAQRKELVTNCDRFPKLLKN